MSDNNLRFADAPNQEEQELVDKAIAHVNQAAISAMFFGFLEVWSALSVFRDSADSLPVLWIFFIEGLVLMVLGFFLYRKKTQTLAIILLVISVLLLGFSFLIMIINNALEAAYIFTPVILLWLTARAIKGARRLVKSNW